MWKAQYSNKQNMADNVRNEIALVVWVNDIPIRGGVLKLSDVISPRREFNEYRTGEKVLARCRGFKGNHECLLARIGGKEMKDEFQNLLVGNRFVQILEEFGLHIITDQQNQTVQQQAESVGVATSGSEETDVSTTRLSNQKTSHKEKRKNPSPKKTIKSHVETDLPTKSVPVKTSTHKEKKKNPSPPKKTSDSHLFQVASDLELTELQESSAEYQHQSGFQIYRPQTPAKKNCVGSVVRGGLMALEHGHSSEDANPSPVKGKTDSCLCGCKAEIERLTEQCHRFEQEFTTLWYWINMIYNMLTPSQKAMGTNSTHVQFLNESSHQKTASSSYQQTASSSFPQWQMSSPTPQQYGGSANTEETPVKQQAEPSHSLSPFQSTYGGYTKSQLVEEIIGIEDYPKAAKRLFRRLYKEEEYLGRTLTGARANNKYDGRPAIKDLSKMSIIYEIMKEKFSVTPVQVREKLRDILKPSKAKTWK